MYPYTDAENTGIPAVPCVDADRTQTDLREDHEESVLSHRL